jgi:hypothetical protein
MSQALLNTQIGNHFQAQAATKGYTSHLTQVYLGDGQTILNRMCC